uniref:DNA pilot protein n=1 Tax=Dulem virus 101 TaxID=3145578 RepID=A0AAU8BAT9_9VIRU
MSLFGSILQSVSDIGSSAFNIWSQFDNRNYSRDLIKQQWQREDTAVQRRVADLKAAGLSPVLAAGQGAASSSPIQVGTPQIESNPLDTAIKVTALKQAKENLKKTKAETENISMLSARTGEEILNLSETNKNLQQDNLLKSLRNLTDTYQLDYARKHNLPVGAVDPQIIKVFEYLFSDRLRELSSVNANTLIDVLRGASVDDLKSKGLTLTPSNREKLIKEGHLKPNFLDNYKKWLNKGGIFQYLKFK